MRAWSCVIKKKKKLQLILCSTKTESHCRAWHPHGRVRGWFLDLEECLRQVSHSVACLSRVTPKPGSVDTRVHAERGLPTHPAAGPAGCRQYSLPPKNLQQSPEQRGPHHTGQAGAEREGVCEAWAIPVQTAKCPGLPFRGFLEAAFASITFLDYLLHYSYK